MGLKIETNLGFEPESLIDIRFDLFDQLQLDTPPMKVLSCAENQEGSFTLILGFIGANENMRQKLRSWIYKQTLNRVA